MNSIRKRKSLGPGISGSSVGRVKRIYKARKENKGKIGPGLNGRFLGETPGG